MPRQKLSKKKGELDYGVLQEPLHNMFTSLSNKLEREWDRRYRHVDSSAVMFFQNFRNAINTYVTIFYVAGDFPKDPLRQPIFALSLPPLTRTLYEQLIMFLFLLEDIPAFVPYLFKTGYTEVRLELKHCLKYHGTKKRWKPYINTLKKRVTEIEKFHALTAREIKDPLKTIGGGPTPGGLKNILRDNRPNSKIIPFIEYMNSWLYRELSGQTHLNILELAGTGVFLSKEEARVRFGKDWEKMRDDYLEEYRQNQIIIAITLMLCISTELEMHFNYGQRERVMFLWTILNEYSDMTKDIWDTRYSTLLS